MRQQDSRMASRREGWGLLVSKGGVRQQDSRMASRREGWGLLVSKGGVRQQDSRMDNRREGWEQLVSKGQHKHFSYTVTPHMIADAGAAQQSETNRQWGEFL